MKLKEINRTAMLSWSPAEHYPIYMASGISAQQLDSSFSNNASLEFFELNLSDPSLDMKSCGALSTSHRYHKLVWSPFGIDRQSQPSGVLIAGGENGNVILYDPAKIMAGDMDVVLAESDRHTGPVRALDINPFQTNLVASGGNESEIYIWDLNNFGSPMTPGPKTQPLEDVSCVAWNRQVQHILASSSPSGRTSVWDLRKNDLIIKVGDHSNRMHCSGMAWNPEVATQLVMASEDDRMPVIQMWDLRFAASPLKIFENHTRGVLAIAWNCADPELLLSSGKDGRILCWNPNTAEVLYERPTGNQWCFDIQWCPRNPAVFSAAGFDGYINIFSIMGGTSQAQSERHVDQISNSFSSIDPFGTGQTLPPLQLPLSVTLPTTVNPLKKPPKWIRTPAGASFAFGGKLVSLENGKPNPPQSTPHPVHVSQVVTETELLKRSNQLQATLSSGEFVGFCQGKIDLSGNKFEKTIWSFLKANFDSDSRTRFLEVLGYNKEDLALKISAALTEKPAEVDIPTPCDAQPVADSIVSAVDASEAEFDLISAAGLQPTATQELVFTLDAETRETQVADDTPAAAFDLIAYENLKPTATLELDSGPPVKGEGILEVNAEEKAALCQAGIDEKVDQATGFIDEEQWDEEEIILEEEVTEPVTDNVAPCEDVLQAPCVEAFQAPHEEGLQDPRTNTLQAPSEETLQYPCADLLQAPCVDALQSPCVDALQAPCVDALQSPCVDALQAPCADVLQAPCADALQAPCADALQAPCADALQAPCADALKAPCADALKAPCADALQAPCADALQAPCADALQAPCADALKAPCADALQAPCADALKAPCADALQAPCADALKAPCADALQAPCADALQAPCADALQAPCADALKAPCADALQAPCADALQAPCADALQAPCADALQAPCADALQAPCADALQAPCADALQAPCADALQAPCVGVLPALSMNTFQARSEEALQDPHVDALQAPSEEILQAPCVNVLQAPCVDAFQAPCEETLQDPHVNVLQAPCVDAFQAPCEETLQDACDETLQVPCVEPSQAVEQLINSEEVLKEPTNDALLVIAPGDDACPCVSQDVDGLITEALLTGDFEGAVELCLHDNRLADGILLAIAGGTELLEKTQKKYFQKSQSKLKKLLSAVVMKDLHDILATCELQNWKEALAAVMTYAQPQEFFSLCDLLGGRLEAANDAQLQAQACLCYICSGNVEKLVSCWTKAQEGNSPLVLQDLVEKVVVMQHAVERTQNSGPAAIGVLLAKNMSQYAKLLASQGFLSTAITYLPVETNQLCVQQLRERLIHALGQQDTSPCSVPSKEPPVAAKFNNPYAVLQPTTTASAQPQYYQPVRAASTVTSWSNQTPTAFPHVPTPLPSGTATGQSQEPPNSMYGMPATGTIAAASTSAPVMYSHQYQTYPQVSQYPQGAGGLTGYQPHHYSSVASPLAEPSEPPQPPGFLSQYSQPVPSHIAYPPVPQNSQCLSFTSSSNPPLFSASSTSTICPIPPSSMAFQHSGPGSPGSYMQLPPLSGVSGPQNGWNDPPTLVRAPKKKLVPENYTPPSPITAPIMAPLGLEPQVHHIPSGSPQFVGQIPQAAQSPYSSMQLQQPLAPQATTSVKPAMPTTSTEGPPGAPTGDVIQPLQSMPAEKITKKPIPDEHMVLKTAFEGLIQRCLAVANDPQTKRKLDDANKRMEALYDKLREQTLSPAIIGGLHNIARTIDSRSYTEGLNLHTHIVSSSNFSEISGFMPVLKVVLTQANRLGV